MYVQADSRPFSSSFSPGCVDHSTNLVTCFSNDANNYPNPPVPEYVDTADFERLKPAISYNNMAQALSSLHSGIYNTIDGPLTFDPLSNSGALELSALPREPPPTNYMFDCNAIEHSHGIIPEIAAPMSTYYSHQPPEQIISPSAATRLTASSKPVSVRCWNHGCGGRGFSSLGNYRRHVREKARLAKTFRCTMCGKVFTRSTARNLHQEVNRCGDAALEKILFAAAELEDSAYFSFAGTDMYQSLSNWDGVQQM